VFVVLVIVIVIVVVIVVCDTERKGVFADWQLDDPGDLFVVVEGVEQLLVVGLEP
jgi:hypothetical protein